MNGQPISHKADKQKGIIVSTVVIVIVFLILKFTHYIMADPPAEDIPLVAETEITQLELKELIIDAGGSLGGAGTPSDDPVDPRPKPQTEKVLTNPKSRSEIQTGQSSHTTGVNLTNTATTIKAAPNPFGHGGGADHGDKSGVFGDDIGPYRGGGEGEEGDGTGKGVKARVRLNNINADDIESNQSCSIFLKLTVNAEGDVVKAENIQGKTTTTDQRIINKVIGLVKSQLKYNKKPGAMVEKIPLTVNLKAS